MFKYFTVKIQRFDKKLTIGYGYYFLKAHEISLKKGEIWLTRIFPLHSSTFPILIMASCVVSVKSTKTRIDFNAFKETSSFKSLSVLLGECNDKEV
jgi:hypothetical protein